jgi:transcriptional regulator with XRE-family HTH domain
VTGSPTSTGSGDEPVGAALARWRKKRKISGHELGQRVGMSQAKISRLENGISTPDPQDVRRIAELLGVPAAEVERLVSLAEGSANQLVDWQSTEPGLPDRQHYVRQLEATAREIRVFQPAVIVGLLQTSEYARALLTPVENDLADEQASTSALAVSEAVSARMQRSQMLYEPHRQFHFVMTEAVLTNQVCRPADMLGQIARLREAAELPNVDIRIVPRDAPWPTAPYHGFEIMGDRCVMVDLFNSSLLSRGRHDIRSYRRVFDAFESIATSDIGPLLDAHENSYIRMMPGVVA